MKKYVILAETGADIPADLVKQYGIYIVPMHVSFGETTKSDGTFPTEEVFHYYKQSGTLPRTSGCNVADFEKILKQIHDEHPESHILYLAYSASTTCSYQSAVIASEGMTNITLFDTKHVSAGQCLVVLLTARYLEAHPDAELYEVMEKVREYSRQCRMGFFPGDLDYLRAGGRVSNVAYLGAKILSLNPLIELLDGKLTATKKYRGSMAKVTKKLTDDFVTQNDLSREILFFIHSPGLSETIMESLSSRARDMGFQEIRWVQTGCVVSTHSGPGAFGIVGLSTQ